jgi:hypothetical protein
MNRRGILPVSGPLAAPAKYVTVAAVGTSSGGTLMVFTLE